MDLLHFHLGKLLIYHPILDPCHLMFVRLWNRLEIVTLGLREMQYCEGRLISLSAMLTFSKCIGLSRDR
jgi:hypothetical protein